MGQWDTAQESVLIFACPWDNWTGHKIVCAFLLVYGTMGHDTGKCAQFWLVHGTMVHKKRECVFCFKYVNNVRLPKRVFTMFNS
jgi:hypothetical protein